MRHFADELRERGWQVDYVKLDDVGNTQSLEGRSRMVAATPRHFARPHDRARRVAFEAGSGTRIEMLEDTRFICSHSAFRQWAANRKELRMEFFYRDMRRQTGLLMNGDKPEGGTWNFDSENRKPAKADMFMPEPLLVVPDEITRAIASL